jgi:hypothetical protein
MKATAKARSLTWSELAIPFAIYFSVYALTLSRVPSIVTDSANYINRIDSGTDLLHPHHLLFNSFAWTWVYIWRRLGVQTDTAILVSQLNAIFGALCMCVFYRILRIRLGCDRGTALLATGLPAFSFGFWYYSGCVEVYIVPLFLLLLSFDFLTGERVDARTFALVGFLNGVAVLFAEMSVLFATVVFLAAWFSYRNGNNSLAKSSASYLLVAVPTTAVPYALALSAVGRANSVQSAWLWLTDYAHYPRFWSPLALSSVPIACFGLGQAFVGSHFLFALPSVRHWVEKMLQDYYLADKAFLVRNLGSGVARLLVALAAAQFLLVIVALASRLRYWTFLSLKRQRFVYLLAVWFLTYGTFTFFYTSINAKFWIAPTLCLWLFFLVFLVGARNNPEEAGQWPRVILAIVVVMGFSVNYMGSIRFTRDQANDYYYSRIKPLVELTRQGDLIVIGTSWKYEPYLVHYGKAQVLSLTSVCKTSGATPESVRRVQSVIDDELLAGGRVVISEEALEPEVETIRRYPEMTAFRTLWEGYRRRWSVRGSQTNAVYVLEDAVPHQLEIGGDARAETLRQSVASFRAKEKALKPNTAGYVDSGGAERN